MKVEIGLREPGNHRVIGAFQTDSVPRVGEAVVINDHERDVHSVVWDVTGGVSVTVWLNP